GEKIIEIDPGMAFGTGQHASTKMALDLIRQVFEEGLPVSRAADIGTGTGILAMGAALFGAGEVMATDNDPEATEAAAANVAANRLDGIITVSDRDLDELNPPFELICANIIHDVLVEMAPTFVNNLLAPTGRVVLAGILSGEQEKNIIKVYTALGLRLLRVQHQEEWAAMLLGRP
ncbi:MAG: 50S ribosomal protein L11 methyltransferase, partial [Desulfobulbaceae bacterium]|nr:50S ribosomal protein L11 methyltransferase [Desulfobulbaceae bacterium]